MNRIPLHSRLCLGFLVLMLLGLAGCVSGNMGDSDLPWNVPPPNDGVPSLPGLSQ